MSLSENIQDNSLVQDDNGYLVLQIYYYLRNPTPAYLWPDYNTLGTVLSEDNHLLNFLG